MQIVCFLVIALCVGLIIFAGNQVLNRVSPLFYMALVLWNIGNIFMWVNILRDVE